MKKTLITLAALALASVASALTTDSYTAEDFNNGVLTLDNAITFDTNWTLQLNLSIGEHYNEWGTPVLASGSTPAPEGNQASFNDGFQFWLKSGLIWRTESEGGNYTDPSQVNDIVVRSESTQDKGQGYSLTKGEFYLFTVSYDSVAKNITATVTSQDGATNYLTMTTEQGSVLNTASDIETLSTGIFSGTASGWTVNSLTVTQVPEPATATLSLLALAGLAARRRRK